MYAVLRPAKMGQMIDLIFSIDSISPIDSIFSIDSIDSIVPIGWTGFHVAVEGYGPE
jgi:hypothetical protein